MQTSIDLSSVISPVQRRRSRCPVIQSTSGVRSSHQYPETPYRLDASPDGIYFFKDQGKMYA
ncbi:hypothetical protein DCAR_0313153 [Daucus carota subsp. sativus]|uniref:Uncharacterized protein n=1 Tax=Daucus carota subsp. sativus TaxID=79200 RepID=A0A161WVY9_DAUCS|nr:hypothetical protein DCAR_0313153 [Daucus carota subsp. sativus]